MKWWAAALLLALGAASARAQEAPWKSSNFPYVVGNPADGPTLVLRWQRTRNAPYFLSRTDTEDVINPLTFSGAVSVEAGIGTLGTRFGRAEFRAPGLAAGWRFRAVAAAERRGRVAWDGVGGDVAEVPKEDPGYFFRTHRTRFLFQGDVTRAVAGALRLAVGWSLDRTELAKLPGPSNLALAYPGGYRRTSFVLRPALVFDTRDQEATPSRGVLLEAGAGFGTGREGPPGDGKSLYGFGYAHLRAWGSVREGTVVAGRVLVRTMEDAAPLSARFGLPGWEREFSLAGADGHRSFIDGALAASNADLVSVEVRHDLLNVGDLGALTLVAFFDYAHLSDNRSATLATRSADLYGGGGGVAVRILRSALLTANFAGGKQGFRFSMGTGWNF